MEPLISVIIPNFGEDTYLVRCLNAIKRQTYKNIEIIIICTSEQKQNVEALKKKYNLIVIERVEEGYEGINEAISKAHGQYIYFCNKTSVMAQNVIEELLKKTEKEPGKFWGGEIYIPNKNEYEASPFEKVNIYNKLFVKDVIDRENIIFSENSVLAECIFVAQYIEKFEDIEIDPEVYVYEADGTYLVPRFRNEVDKQEWENLFSILESMEKPTADILSNEYLELILKNGLANTNIMFLLEQYDHKNYPLNYAVAEQVLPSLWTEIRQKNDEEKSLILKDYFERYEGETAFFDLLLSACELNEEEYGYLKNNDLDTALFFIRESKKDCAQEIYEKKVEAAAMKAVDKIVPQVTEEVTKQIAQNLKVETIANTGGARIVEGTLENFVVSECRAGKLGLRSVWKIFKAWAAFKVKKA